MISAVTSQEPAVQEEGLAGAARALPSQIALSGAEQQLQTEWLRPLSAPKPS